MLYPPGLRKYLFEFVLRDAGDFAFLIKQDGERIGRASIESRNKSHTVEVMRRLQKRAHKKWCRAAGEQGLSRAWLRLYFRAQHYREAQNADWKETHRQAPCQNQLPVQHNAWLTVQPEFQWYEQPSGNKNRGSVFVTGFRTKITFQQAAET
jgi:hypothetical protein